MKSLRRAQREALSAEAIAALGLDPVAQVLHAQGYRLMPVHLPRQPNNARVRLRLVWRDATGEGVLTVRYTRTMTPRA